MADIAGLRVVLSGDASGVTKATSEAKAALSSVSSSASSATSGLSKLTGGLKGSQLALQSAESAANEFGGSLLGTNLAIAGIVGAIVLLKQAYNEATAGTRIAKESLAAYNAEISKQTGNVQAEIANVDGLVKAVENENLSRKARQKALDELQEKYPAYFSNQKIDISNTDALKTATDSLTAALVRQARAKGFTDLIADTEKKISELKLGSLDDQVSVLDYTVGLFKGLGDVGDAAMATIGRTTARTNEQIKVLTTTSQKYKDELAKVIAEQFQFGDELGKTAKAKGVKDDLFDTLRKNLAKLRVEYNLGIIDAEKYYGGVSAAYKAGVDALVTLGRTEDNLYVKRFAALSNQYNTFKNLAQLFSSIKFSVTQAELKNPLIDKTGEVKTIKIPVLIEANFLTDAQKVKRQAAIALGNVLLQQGQALKTLAAQAFSEGLGNLGNVLGDILTGKGLTDAFNRIGNFIGSLIKKFGEILVQSGVQILLLKQAAKALIANPFLSIAAGILAQGVGAALQNSFSGIGSFAKGGQVFGKQLAVVGDNPSGKEAMIPYEDFGKVARTILGQGSGGYIADARISGNDLLLVFNRASIASKR